MQPLRIGMASDLHLGRLFGSTQLDTLADIMRHEKVDIILLPGDIMDDNVNAYLAEKMRLACMLHWESMISLASNNALKRKCAKQGSFP